MVNVFIPAWTGDVNSLGEKASLHGGSFGSQGGTLDGKVVLRGIREDLKDARFKERVVRLPVRADQPTHVTSDSAVGEVKSLRGTEQYRSQHSRWNHRHDFVRGRPSEIIGVAWGNSDRVRNITPVIQTIQCSHQKRLRASAFS
jgi:hypothetical protein